MNKTLVFKKKITLNRLSIIKLVLRLKHKQLRITEDVLCDQLVSFDMGWIDSVSVYGFCVCVCMEFVDGRGSRVDTILDVDSVDHKLQR